MYDGPAPPTHGGVSVLEQDLERFLRKLPGRPVFLVDHPPHGRRPAEPPPAEEPAAEDPLERRMASLAGLLETGAGHLAAAAAAAREQGRQAAVQARALAAFAACRPAAVLDRPDAEVGAAAAASRAARPAALTAVSEWAVDEAMALLGLSSAAAGALLQQSVTLVAQLPGTLRALEAGVISWAHAVMLADVLPLLTDPAQRATVEADLLGRAAGKTVPQLREAARRAVLRADASAAVRRMKAAIRDRQVRLFPGRDGMAGLTATMPLPLAAACRTALAAYARECITPGDPRTQDQRMVDCLADLILRPAADRPPVGIDLQLIASVSTLAGGDEPGEVDGHPVPARLVRELAYTLGLLPRPQPPADPNIDLSTAAEPGVTLPGGTAPTTTDADHTDAGHTDAGVARPPADPNIDMSTAVESDLDMSTAADPHIDMSTAAGLADLLDLRTVAGTALTHPPTIAVVDELTGQLLALTNATEIRHAASCGRPACRTGRRACDHPPRRPGPRPATAHSRLRPLRGAAAVRPRPRPALPLPRLPGRRHPLRPRPQPALARRTHLRRQPLLPVPPPPPAQPPGPRLDHAPPARRRPAMDHPRRTPAHHPPAALRHRRPPTTAARPTDSRPTDDQPTPHPDRTRPRPTPPTRHHRPRPRAVLITRSRHGSPHALMHHDGMTSIVGEALRQRCIEAVLEEGELVRVIAQQMSAGLTPTRGGLDVPVPWVPEWTARELVGHLGTVYRWATAIVSAGHTDPPAREATHSPPRDGLLDWYAAGLAELISTLRTTPPDSPAWHMSPTAEKTAASWVRRQAHELVVHRMDLEVAAGLRHAPLDTELAEDGVDELLTVIIPRWAHTEPLTSAVATVAATATDTGRTWSLRIERGAVTVRPDRTGTDDAHLHGDVTQLLLRLWGRPADVGIDGDPAAEALLRGR